MFIKLLSGILNVYALGLVIILKVAFTIVSLKYLTVALKTKKVARPPFLYRYGF
jgi:hypothetical protein